MADDMPSLMITRPGDLARVGLGWRAAQLTVAADGPMLVAGDGAVVTLVLPPQSTAEQAIGDHDADAAASLGGPSLLRFSVAAGTRIPLTAEGLFAALAGGSLVAAEAAADVGGTLLDLPANLISTIGTGGATFSCTSAPDAPSGGIGLCQIHLDGPAGPMMLRPLATNADAPGLPVPALTAQTRQSIVDAGAELPATLALSALGATLDADLVTDSFSWSHRAALGRDQDVVIVEKGVLYPLGHRATKVTTIRRAIGADGSPAALHSHPQIIVTEPIRTAQRQDFRFAQVEMLTRRLEFVQSLDPQKRPVPPGLTDAQQAELAALDEQAGQAAAERDRYVALFQGGDKALADDGNYPAAAEYVRLQTEIEELQEAIDDPNLPIDDHQRALDRAQIKADAASAAALLPEVQRERADVKQRANDAGARFRSLSQQFVEKKAEIQAINDAAANVPMVAFVPADSHGDALKFDVRMATPSGALTVQMPAIFVHELVQPATAQLPAYASLQDSATIAALKKLWTDRKHGEVAVPGVAFDLVQAAVPQPGDVHEVYKLAIEAAGVAETYLPRIARIDAKIASLRALLPDADSLTPLVYNLGADADLSPLKPVVPIVVDFLTHADRSGGLVAPKFTADALSRTLGPAASAALDAAHVPDFKQLYKDARLLGLSLGDIIDAAQSGVAIPNGPTIVPILEGVRPIGVTMEWHNLPLKAAGMFRPLDRDQRCFLDLETRISGSSGSDTVTRATVHNFALALPPAEALVTIGFAVLEMEQKAGKPPDVNAKDFRFALGNELQLLDDLQEKVLAFIGANNPGIVVRRTEDGIAAGYAFALPEVASGVFLMRNLGVAIDVGIPFNGKAVTIALGFARADNPFALAVTIFGGGGYFLIKMSRDVVQGIELSLSFGAFVAVSFVVARGEVHAYGLITLKIDADGKAEFNASIKLGGSVEVLGIVSVSVELTLLLEYAPPPDNYVFGEATLVIEVHLPFFSRSVRLDSGRWILAGSDRGATHRLAGTTDAVPLDPASARATWNTYWQAFSTWTP